MVQISFDVAVRQAQELHHVRVAEYFVGLRLHPCQRGRHLHRLQHRALEQRGFELALGPAFLHTAMRRVELALVRPVGLLRMIRL
jgi:hypothetical protein